MTTPAELPASSSRSISRSGVETRSCGVVWPDWSGQTALIVATGPSATDYDLSVPREGVRCIVIRSSWRLAPWADVLYGLDKEWWIAHQGCPEFRGLKVSPSPTACKVYGLRQVRLKPRADVLVDEIGVLGCGLSSGGGHSGFQACNLAVQFGARRLVLIGFDMTLARGAHWLPNDRGVARPDAGRVASWRQSMDACAPRFAELGVEVINASRGSALSAYRKMELTEALS